MRPPASTSQSEVEVHDRAAPIDAAESVFHDKGVARASLEEIAANAQVTRGAVYWHFKDKAELFDAMMQRVVLPAEDMLERAGAAGESNPLELLRRATVEVLLRTAKDARVQRVFDIAYHKCEYVGDAAGVRARQQRELAGGLLLPRARVGSRAAEGEAHPPGALRTNVAFPGQEETPCPRPTIPPAATSSPPPPEPSPRFQSRRPPLPQVPA